MTVADLQKFLRGLADTIASAGASGVAEELRDVAKAMQPLATRDLSGFAKFLTTAKEAGDSVLLTLVKSLYDRATDPSLTREQVESQIRSHAGAKKNEFDAAVAGVGIKQRPKSKIEAIETLIRYVMGRKGSAARTGA
jgi:hypothetical protein